MLFWLHQPVPSPMVDLLPDHCHGVCSQQYRSSSIYTQQCLEQYSSSKQQYWYISTLLHYCCSMLYLRRAGDQTPSLLRVGAFLPSPVRKWQAAFTTVDYTYHTGLAAFPS